MENVLNFLADNYLYFMIGSVVLLFALIGFAVEGRKKKKEDIPMNPANNMMNQIPNINQMNQNTQVPNENINQMQDVNQNLQMSDNQNLEFNEVSYSQPNLDNLNSVASVETPSLDNLNNEQNNSEEILTFGPISTEENESIFTEPPVMDNNVNNEVPSEVVNSNEPVMETLDLGVPQMQSPEVEMPVSMEKEEPFAAPEGPTMTSEPVMETNTVEPPVYNNTLQ